MVTHGPSRHAALVAAGLRHGLLRQGFTVRLGLGLSCCLTAVLALPLLNLSPLVLLASGWLVLGERPEPMAAAGVVLLVLGALHAVVGLPLLLAVALLALLGTSLQMEALQSTDVVHVVAIKRLSTLLGSVAGVVWLGEPGGALRLPAAGLLFSGALIVLLAAHA